MGAGKGKSRRRRAVAPRASGTNLIVEYRPLLSDGSRREGPCWDLYRAKWLGNMLASYLNRDSAIEWAKDWILQEKGHGTLKIIDAGGVSTEDVGTSPKPIRVIQSHLDFEDFIF